MVGVGLRGFMGVATEKKRRKKRGLGGKPNC